MVTAMLHLAVLTTQLFIFHHQLSQLGELVCMRGGVERERGREGEERGGSYVVGEWREGERREGEGVVEEK